MTNAWWCQVVVDSVVQTDGQADMSNLVFVPYGDSMLIVNSHGVRVGDEKAMYNERTQTHFVTDGLTWPNLVQVMIWDEAVASDPTPWPWRGGVPLPGLEPPWLMKADSLEDLAALGGPAPAVVARAAGHLGPHQPGGGAGSRLRGHAGGHGRAVQRVRGRGGRRRIRPRPVSRVPGVGRTHPSRGQPDHAPSVAHRALLRRAPRCGHARHQRWPRDRRQRRRPAAGRVDASPASSGPGTARRPPPARAIWGAEEPSGPPWSLAGSPDRARPAVCGPRCDERLLDQRGGRLDQRIEPPAPFWRTSPACSSWTTSASASAASSASTG